MSPWERIGPQHKEGRPLVAVTHEMPPQRYRLVRWGAILGKPRWCDVDNFHHYDPETFTHAYIVPEFGMLGHGSRSYGETSR